MAKIRLLSGGCLLFMIFCAADGFAQNNPVYPQNADGVIDFVETLFKTDFSSKEGIERLGTVEKNDKFDRYFISLKPFSSGRETIKTIEVYVDDADKKIGSVDFKYIAPVKIAYGVLRKKYGALQNNPSPIVNCEPGTKCNRRLFVGYFFESSRLISGKKVKLLVILQMEATGKFPKHTDSSLLEVEAISFRRLMD